MLVIFHTCIPSVGFAFYRARWRKPAEGAGFDLDAARSSLAALGNFPGHLSDHTETDSCALDMRPAHTFPDPN